MINNATNGLSFRWKILIAIFFSLCFGLIFGLNYGISNQNTYLLHGLKLFDGSLFNNDWLASECADYHPFFSYLSWFLYYLSAKGWAFGIMNVIVTTIGGIFIYLILKAIAQDKIVIPAFLIVLSILGVTLTFSVSSSYIFSDIFQPSSLGSLRLLAAIYLFLKEKYFISGITLAIGGIFHANFLVLGFPLFIITHLLLGRSGFFPRIVKQLGPSLIALIPLVPLILKTSGSIHRAEAAEILFKIRSPHHYLPTSFWKEFIPFTGWLIASIGVRNQIFSELKKWKLLRSLIISFLVLIAGATLLTSIIYIPSVAQLYFWRLAPFAALLFQIIASIGLITIISEGNKARITISDMLFLAAGLIFVNAPYVYNKDYRLLIISVIILGIIFYFHFFGLKSSITLIRNCFLPKHVAIVVWVLGCAMPLKDFTKKSTLIGGLSDDETALYSWAQTSSKDAIFLIPPGMQRFRLHAKRAVIVDWKSTPILPEELVEWYHRIEIVSGIPRVSSLEKADSGFYCMDQSRLENINGKYNYDYIIARRNQIDDIPQWLDVVYKNSKYYVLKRK